MTGAATQSAAPSHAVILNVDDHDAARYAKGRILRAAGFTVVEAATGADALRLAREAAPDVALLDVKLPDIDGIEVCRRLKADPSTASILVVQNSASFVGPEDRVRGLEGGADTYLTSPIDPAVLVATVRSLLRLRRTERELHESRQQLRAFLDQVRDYAIFRITPDGRMASWNQGVKLVLGYDEPEFLGLPASVIFTPEEQAAGVPQEELATAADEGRATNDRWMARRDGSRFWAMGVTTVVRDERGNIAGYLKVMRDQTDWKAAQDALRESEGRLSAANDALAAHKEDLERIVAQRTVELRESHERLRTTERMAALGTLSAGLGHDMGNLLLPLRLRLESLESAQLPKDLAEDVDAIRTSARYLQRLANGLRLLAVEPDRSRRAGGGATEIGAWWADAGSVVRAVLPPGVVLRAEIPASPSGAGECWASISPAALTQAVFNLVQNAGDAITNAGGGATGGGRGGQVTVSVRASGDTVLVGVADDGPGMPEEVRRRCMEPFFTTKMRGISTGMGLALVYGLVRDAGGEVRLESEPGRGTAFTLVLRAARRPQEERALERRAVVTLKDVRMRAFVIRELRQLSFSVEEEAPIAAPDGVELWVIDPDHAELPAMRRSGAQVLVLGDATEIAPRFVALGPRPAPTVVSRALRRLAGESSADESLRRDEEAG